VITLIVTVKVNAGKMDEAVEVLREIVPKIKEAEPGCLVYIPHRVRGEDNTIIFYEKYRDQEALKVHSSNVPKSLEKLLPLLEPGMDIKTCYEIV
jgi:quinol monooxygenase YgiN